MASVSISPELKDLVRVLRRTGRYGNDSEVIRAGLRLLEEKEIIRQGLRLLDEKITAEGRKTKPQGSCPGPGKAPSRGK
jgi:putative addiction module CopG family antidote